MRMGSGSTPDLDGSRTTVRRVQPENHRATGINILGESEGWNKVLAYPKPDQ